MVSTRTTYILWLLFGWAGLHHLYLGRLNHAFVWFVTLGGGCGVGWVRDYWRIPEYIQWYSPDKAHRKKFLHRASSNNKPECSKFRNWGMVLMGYALSTALSSLVPDHAYLAETNPITYQLVLCVTEILRLLGNALGIYLVANIGELKCSLFYPLACSLFAVPVLSYIFGSAALASTISVQVVARKGIKWRALRPEPEKRGKIRMCGYFCVYVVACTAWLVMAAAGFYLNGSVMNSDGEKVRASEYLASFMSQKDVQDAVKMMQDVFQYVAENGLWNLVVGICKQLDFTETLKAYKTVGVFPGTSQETIAKICRKQLAETHPDRFKLPEDIARAQQTFIEVHKACAAISTTRHQKTRENEL